MRNLIISLITLLPFCAFAQESEDGTAFKKRALENTELSILTSFYTQDGKNAAVTGGIGSEQLNDYATNILVSIPVKQDGILSIDGTISAYTSASSSNLNPWSGASNGEGDDDDDDDDNYTTGANTGTPWAASSGASRQDVWTNLTVGYSRSSEDRNTIYSGNMSVANEYDYFSLGVGAGLVKLFNQKNTELGITANVYLDNWRPEYATEIKTYIENGGDLNRDFFEGTDILDQNGNIINKMSVNAWKPTRNILINDTKRNTYAASLSLFQILGKTTQVSLFTDIVYQTGWLANPMQRVYFADKSNFYIGTATSIPFYSEERNKGVFQLADDIERLPNNRLKIPIGIRLNQYITENLVLRSYYRYYFDNWGITGHTLNAELALKLAQKFTLYPNYRLYTQTAADYFAPFEQHLSTEEFYTSDFDLSKFSARQVGLGLKYTDIFTKSHIWKFGLKNLTLDYNYYNRNTGLKAHIISLGADFIIDN
ncbi:DUF3570 domain-containing protein [Flagellimonas marinaquae]|uniref:DUF3570 domain-containing protein n=1 Tax=Flagellimonas marinaquae TaxID=254955 RepID=UPI000F8D1510|nr:DUF3570 domain-containing protein [Allomuricauda aquimarina]